MSRSALVQPTREEMPRWALGVWIREEALGDDFLASINVPGTYRDSPAEVAAHGEVFFDTGSRIALDASGAVITANLSIAPDEPRIAPRVERLREQVSADQVIAIADPGPHALLASPRHDNYYHFLFDDLGRLGFYDALTRLQSARLPIPPPKPWQRELYGLAGIEARPRPLPEGAVAPRDVWMAPRGLAKIAEMRSRAFDRVLAIGERAPDEAQDGPSRIYVSRQGTRHRRLLNEDAVRACVVARLYDRATGVDAGGRSDPPLPGR